MTEEEKKAINLLNSEILDNEKLFKEVGSYKFFNKDKVNAVKVILNLIDKYQKEIDQLANGIRVLGTNPDITTEEIIKEFTEKPISEEYMKEFESGYISKDKVLKALGYEENSEAYNRMDSEEKVISLIRLVNAECDRLEDIEDKKVILETHNIENMRDKYWQKKINDKIKEIEEHINFENTEMEDYAIAVLKELLKEN